MPRQASLPMAGLNRKVPTQVARGLQRRDALKTLFYRSFITSFGVVFYKSKAIVTRTQRWPCFFS